MRISKNGLDIIRHFEGINDNDLSRIGFQPKMDPKGYWTAGIGHLILHEGKPLAGLENQELAYSLYPNMDEADAEWLLTEDVRVFEDKLNKLTIEFTQNQFDALVSFCFNVGFGAFLNSTLRKRIVGGGDIKEAFLMWNKCNGKALRGLTLRREAEANLYLS